MAISTEQNTFMEIKSEEILCFKIAIDNHANERVKMFKYHQRKIFNNRNSLKYKT